MDLESLSDYSYILPSWTSGHQIPLLAVNTIFFSVHMPQLPSWSNQDLVTRASAFTPVAKRVSRQAWPGDKALVTGKQMQFWAEHRVLSLSSQYLSVRWLWGR